MAIDYLLVASSLLAIIGTALLAFGYRESLFSGDPATRGFAWCMAFLAASIFCRRFTWDILHPVVTGDLDQRPLNIAFNVLAIAGAYFGLRSRLALIPPCERDRWRWWSAWAHPGLFRPR